MIGRLFLLAALAALPACAAAPPRADLPSGPCPVVASSGWRAWVNVLPGRMNTGGSLHVVGNVTVPSGDWTPRLASIRVMESYPVQVVVELDAQSSGAGIQIPVEREVRGNWASEERVGSVIIVCRGATLARIAPVDTAH